MQKPVIKSISYDQHEILRNILDLHCKSRQISVDLCYGHGGFYQEGIPEPLIKIEIDRARARKHGAICADCTKPILELEQNANDIVILDGPFGIGSGPSLKKKKAGQNITPGRFSCFSTGKVLFDFYEKALTQAYETLKMKGWLIQKIQPVVGCGEQWMTHVHCINFARSLGFKFADEFILLAKARPISGKIKQQQNARKFHSYFYVFKKVK